MGLVDIGGSFAGTTEISSSLGDVNVSTDLSGRDYGYDMDVSMGDIFIDGVEQKHSVSRSGGAHYLGSTTIWATLPSISAKNNSKPSGQLPGGFMSNKIPGYAGGHSLSAIKTKKTPFDLGEACGLVTANEKSKGGHSHGGMTANSLAYNVELQIPHSVCAKV